MRKATILLPLAGLLLCGAVSASSTWRERRDARDAAALEKALAGKVAGKPESCVWSRDLGGPESVGETKLLFRVSRNLVYVNETRGSCDGVGAGGRALITRSHGSQLCRGDLASTADLNAGYEDGFCAMGDFTPYRTPKPAR